jgi:lipopolysaccharide/colanic/teichoic acid biosynthesis glycosyltransferase
LLDRALSLAGLICLSPVLALVAAAIRIDSRGPIIFRQVRLGKNGVPFVMFKFRTMRNGADDAPHRAAFERFRRAESLEAIGAQSFKLQDDPRVTRVGAFLRSTSLDELPQLANVLLGTMSLVGPRPPIPYETEVYEPRHWARMAALPGITGPWQALSRSRASFEEMVAMDLEYISSVSLRRDVRLLFLTVGAVVRRDGAG